MKFTYGTEASKDTRGKPYVTLTSAGIFEEGQNAPFAHRTDGGAWRAYFSNLTAYVDRQSGAGIEWRLPPKLEEQDGMFRVYSRLSVL